MDQTHEATDPKMPVHGSGYPMASNVANTKLPSRSTTLDTESRLFDPSVIANLRSNNYKRVRRLSGGSKLSNFYYIGSELRICNDGKKASTRPILRNIIDRATGEPKVLKIISKNRIPQSVDGLTNWRRLCEKLMNMGRFNNLMRIEQVYESDSSFYAVTEKLTGGELFEFLLKEKAIPEDICKYIMRQILQAVHILHSNNLLHRDIKPENIMFRHPIDSKLPIQERYELVLIDFDTCKMTNSALAERIEIINGKRRLVGTYGYLAPEIWRGDDYSTASDLWPVGIVLYILMTGVPPIAMDKMYDAKTSHMVLSAAETSGLDFNMPPLMEFPLATDLCKRLLCFDRKRRISSAADALAHPWLTGLPSIFDRGLYFTGTSNIANLGQGNQPFPGAGHGGAGSAQGYGPQRPHHYNSGGGDGRGRGDERHHHHHQYQQPQYQQRRQYLEQFHQAQEQWRLQQIENLRQVNNHLANVNNANTDDSAGVNPCASNNANVSSSSNNNVKETRRVQYRSIQKSGEYNFENENLQEVNIKTKRPSEEAQVPQSKRPCTRSSVANKVLEAMLSLSKLQENGASANNWGSKRIARNTGMFASTTTSATSLVCTGQGTQGKVATAHVPITNATPQRVQEQN